VTCQPPCPADIRSVWWPASDWNAGRHHVGTVAGFRLESVADFVGIHTVCAITPHDLLIFYRAGSPHFSRAFASISQRLVAFADRCALVRLADGSPHPPGAAFTAKVVSALLFTGSERRWNVCLL
jgi:hypothetical protein